MKALRAKLSGEIIDEFTLLEVFIEQAIAMYFTNHEEKKSKELRHILISTETFSFNNKKTMLWFIIKQFPEFYKKNKGFDKILSQCVSFRNNLAHGKLSSDFENIKYFNEKYIVLETWKTDETKITFAPLPLNQEIVDKENDKIMYAQQVVLNLHTHMIQKKELNAVSSSLVTSP